MLYRDEDGEILIPEVRIGEPGWFDELMGGVDDGPTRVIDGRLDKIIWFESKSPREFLMQIVKRQLREAGFGEPWKRSANAR